MSHATASLSLWRKTFLFNITNRSSACFLKHAGPRFWVWWWRQVWVLWGVIPSPLGGANHLAELLSGTRLPSPAPGGLDPGADPPARGPHWVPGDVSTPFSRETDRNSKPHGFPPRPPRRVYGVLWHFFFTCKLRSDSEELHLSLFFLAKVNDFLEKIEIPIV